MRSPLPISSPHNPRYKRALKLRQSRHRQAERRFVIEGRREILLALRGGIALEELFFCPELCAREDAQQLIALAAEQGASVYAVSRPMIDKLCFGDRSEGLLAVAVMPLRELANLTLPDRPLVAVLEGIEKPGNVGAIFRTADGAGIDAVIIADGGTDLFNPQAIRASLGTVFTVVAACASSGEVAAWLKGQGLPIFAARVEGAVDYAQADFAAGGAIVLGSEAHGLSPAWSGSGVTAIRLPMRGAADSLNVSAAAAVLFYAAAAWQHSPSK